MAIESQTSLEKRLDRSVKTARMLRQAAQTVRDASQQAEPEPTPARIELTRSQGLGQVQR